ncbi:MAG: hypothetical protein DRJ42_09200 [Deltaproteobacteria bacterium]|nr:MAG: hypothetical protein DRJ42_09200 [Deltaproteobacteria bacterium]
MFRQAKLGVAVVAVALSAFSLVASATVLEEVSLEDMALRSDAIVHGVVVSTGTRLVMDDEGAEPHTLTTIRVIESLKGDLGSTVIVRERGGETQGRGMWIAGTPRYAVGEEVVVFLERWTTRPNALRTFGMIQGKFRVRHTLGGGPASVERDLDGVGFAQWADDGTMSVEHREAGPAAALDTFLAFVEGVVHGGGR